MTTGLGLRKRKLRHGNKHAGAKVDDAIFVCRDNGQHIRNSKKQMKI